MSPPTPTVPASIAVPRKARLTLRGLGSHVGVSASESSQSGSGRGLAAPVGSLWVPPEYRYSMKFPGRVAFKALLLLRVPWVPPGHRCPGRFPFRVPSTASLPWPVPAGFLPEHCCPFRSPGSDRLSGHCCSDRIPVRSSFAGGSGSAGHLSESGFGIGRSLCLALLPSGALPSVSLCFDPEGFPPPSQWQCP